MKKRIFALLLAAMLPLGAAIADEPLTDGTVLVDWVDGQEAYTAICSGELTLRYDADTNTYATALYSSAASDVYKRQAEGDSLTDVRLLAQYDPFWAYARATMRDGTMLWGFVPLMAVQLNDTVDAEAMANISGTWGFCGGGELMGWVFTLMADGQGVCYAISDEASESMRYLTEGITADMNPESAGMFQWQIVGGTNGYAHDFVLSSSNGTYERYHAALTEDGYLGFYQCEAGGHYQRLP